MELNNICGREGGKTNAHVAATTLTPPIAHNTPHTKRLRLPAGRRGIHPAEYLGSNRADNRRDRLP